MSPRGLDSLATSRRAWQRRRLPCTAGERSPATVEPGRLPGRPRPGLICLAWLLILILLSSVAACGEPIATPEPTYLSAAGAMEMATIGGELAAAFGEEQPTIHLEVSGQGTQYGLEALYAGETEIALASWLSPDPATAPGLGLEPGYRATAIARDGIAVIVHPSNPVDEVGLLQLQDLFGGRIYEWRALTAHPTAVEIQVISREEGAGTRAAFESAVMLEQRITPRAMVQSSPQATVEYVASHPEAIGYVSMGSVSPAVKVLKIEGELPTPESAAQGSYVLSRELWLVTADPPADAVASFLDFASGPAGQQIVGQQFGRIR